MLRTFALPALLATPLLISTASAQTAAPPAAEQASRCDAGCVRANMERAAQACARPIEAQSPIDYEWITRPFVGIFDEADPSGPNDSVVLYRGDSIRYMSQQKEWIRVVYECGYDVAAQKLVKLNVRPGRVGRPAPQQVAAGQNAPRAPAGAKIQADLLAQAIAKAAANRNGAKPASSRRVAFGEPSPVEVQQVGPH